MQFLDVSLCMTHPVLQREQQNVHMELSGSFQIIGHGVEDSLIGVNTRWEKELVIPVDENAVLLARSGLKGKKQVSGTTIGCDIAVDMMVTALTDIPMVTALELGDPIVRSSEKPSLILRRVGDDTLWHVAKTCGSTVDEIREVNGLIDDPTADQVLLIPVS